MAIVPEACPDCGLNHTWGGMGWRPHSASYHAGLRRLYLGVLARMMRRHLQQP